MKTAEEEREISSGDPESWWINFFLFICISYIFKPLWRE